MSQLEAVAGFSLGFAIGTALFVLALASGWVQ